MIVFKISARGFSHLKQREADGYSEKILKYSNGNSLFFFAQINQRTERPKITLERLACEGNCQLN